MRAMQAAGMEISRFFVQRALMPASETMFGFRRNTCTACGGFASRTRSLRAGDEPLLSPQQ